MKAVTGLFLGAGASYEAGMPLVWEITNEIKSWLTAAHLRELNEGWRIQGTGFSDTVIDDLISVLARPDMHYEAVLGYMEAQFRRQRTQAQQYYGLYSWLVEVVYNILYLRHTTNLAFLERYLPRYDGLRALVAGNAPLRIFSLNHDLIVEAIASRLSIPLYSGFSPNTAALPRRNGAGQKIGELRAEILTKHELEHAAMYYPNPPQPGIYLMKIHGGLDIFTFNDGHDLMKFIPEAADWKNSIEMLRAVNEDLCYLLPGAPGGKAKGTNQIPYADDQGVMQFLRRSLLAGAFKFDARGTQVLPMSMLRHFRDNLNFLTTLVCIGYGFGDIHINLVLRDWLAFSADRKIEIVSPDANAVPSFLQHLANQITLTRLGAMAYFDHIAGIVRPRREAIEQQIMHAKRVLGKNRSDQILQSFLAQDNERMRSGFLAKLQALPLVDGKPDYSTIGDPAETAQQWTTDLKLGEEAFLDALLAKLNEALSDAG